MKWKIWLHVLLLPITIPILIVLVVIGTIALGISCMMATLFPDSLA